MTIGNIPIEVVPKDPIKYPSLGWIRDVTHVLNWFLYNEVSDLSNERRAQVVLQVIDNMTYHMKEWFFRRELQPLWYMGYLVELVKKLSGIILKEMKGYTLWIKAGSFYHLRVWQLKKLQECSHLQNLDPPRQDLEPPSTTSLRTHEVTFEAAKKNPEIEPEASRKARDKYSEALLLHGQDR